MITAKLTKKELSILLAVLGDDRDDTLRRLETAERKKQKDSVEHFNKILDETTGLIEKFSKLEKSKAK